METRYGLPKIGGFRKIEQTEHSLFFDSALTDRVIRQNAFEQRILAQRIHVIEREKQHSLEKFNFYQNQFLIRHKPVLCRQKNLQEASLLKSLAGKTLPSKLKPQDLSSTYFRKSRTRSGTDKKDKAVRKILTQSSYRPVPQENMEDILNGYRTVSKPAMPAETSPFRVYAAVTLNKTETDENCSSSLSNHSSECFSKTARPESGFESSDIDTISTTLPELEFPRNQILTRCRTSYNPSPINVKQIFDKENLVNVRGSRAILDNFFTRKRSNETGIIIYNPIPSNNSTNCENDISFKKDNDVCFLSDAKIQQRQVAQQHIRIMRTVVLAYDTIYRAR